jgi:FkbM family methyltransferase
MRKRTLALAAWAAGILPGWARRLVYRIDPLAGWIRNSLNRAAPQGLAVVAVAAGELAGCRLSLDLQAEKDYWLGTYEPDLQAAIARWVQPGMVVYDVGANIGYISLMMARRAGERGRVFSFEPLPGNLERMRENIALNGLTERVLAIPAAVIEDRRAVQFLVGPSGGTGKAEGSAGRQEIAYRSSLEVKGISLDQFVYQDGNPPPQVVKVDIEGGEVLALPGMQRLLQEARPVLMMELHGPEAARVTWEVLQKASYQVCRMQVGYPVVSSLDAFDWKVYIVGIPVP